MKKLITVAALASVALASDFLGHHRPLAVVKDGLNIVKDVKSHSYGKLIKDGVKLHKDLKLEDQELYGWSDVDEYIRQKREEVALLEEKGRIREEEVMTLKKKISPALFEQILEDLDNYKLMVAKVKKEIDNMEMLAEYGKANNSDDTVKFTPARKLFADSLGSSAKNEAMDQLREAKEKVEIAEAALLEYEEVNKPWMEVFFPDTYPQWLEKIKIQKQDFARAKKEIAEAENAIKNSSKSTDGATKFRKSRPDDDDELFTLSELVKEGKKIKEEIKRHI